MVGYSADDYLRFSADKETIYYSEPVYACEDAYVLPTNDNSEQWGVRSDGHWTYVNCLMYSFPPQGWKIHITSTIYDAQNVLYDVAEYLFVKSILTINYIFLRVLMGSVRLALIYIRIRLVKRFLLILYGIYWIQNQLMNAMRPMVFVKQFCQ